MRVDRRGFVGLIAGLGRAICIREVGRRPVGISSERDRRNGQWRSTPGNRYRIRRSMCNMPSPRALGCASTKTGSHTSGSLDHNDRRKCVDCCRRPSPPRHTWKSRQCRPEQDQRGRTDPCPCHFHSPSPDRAAAQRPVVQRRGGRPSATTGWAGLVAAILTHALQASRLNRTSAVPSGSPPGAIGVRRTGQRADSGCVECRVVEAGKWALALRGDRVAGIEEGGRSIPVAPVIVFTRRKQEGRPEQGDPGPRPDPRPRHFSRPLHGRAAAQRYCRSAADARGSAATEASVRLRRPVGRRLLR